MVGIWEIILVVLLVVLVGIIVAVGLVFWLTRRNKE
jgi:hypothetical protein